MSAFQFRLDAGQAVQAVLHTTFILHTQQGPGGIDVARPCLFHLLHALSALVLQLSDGLRQPWIGAPVRLQCLQASGRLVDLGLSRHEWRNRWTGRPVPGKQGGNLRLELSPIGCLLVLQNIHAPPRVFLCE